MSEQIIEKTEIIITEEMLNGIDIQNFEEAISDAISNITGFCHKGFTWEVKVTAELDTSD